MGFKRKLPTLWGPLSTMHLGKETQWNISIAFYRWFLTLIAAVNIIGLLIVLSIIILSVVVVILVLSRWDKATTDVHEEFGWSFFFVSSLVAVADQDFFSVDFNRGLWERLVTVTLCAAHAAFGGPTRMCSNSWGRYSIWQKLSSDGVLLEGWTCAR